MKALKNREGFTVIEVIIAIGILTIGLVGTLPLVSSAIRANTLSKNKSVALFLADAQVERIKSWPIYDILSTDEQGLRLNNSNLFDGSYECDSMTNPHHCWEESVRLNAWATRYRRDTWMLRNGHTTPYYCNPIVFSNSTLPDGVDAYDKLDEGRIYPATYDNGKWEFDSDYVEYSDSNLSNHPVPTLNHEGYGVNYFENDECYRGEDFVAVRVDVSWQDLFGGHSVSRNTIIRAH